MTFRRAVVALLAAVVSTVTWVVPAAAARRAQSASYPETAVDVVDNDFEPATVTVAPGTEVVWTNNGRSAHNLVASVKQQDFGAPFGVKTSDLRPGDAYDFRFDVPGTYRYYCTLHGTPTSGMRGTVVVTGAGGQTGAASGAASAPTRSGTIRVPKDFPTVQQAVDAAKPGSMVLVAPGVYHEAVTVTGEHRDIVIRGESRAGTILDGGFSDEPGMENGIKVLADGVAIENMTARNFSANGFFWTGVDGYRGSYLTASRNGDYGIYAFDSVHGQFDHDYGAGSPDAGFYIGQCTRCDALITDSEAEWNGLGYSGTNAGGNLVITRSSWHDNRAGIVPNSGTEEANPPQTRATIVGNLVYDNNNANTAAIDLAKLAIGNGILVYGGVDDVVARNRVMNHDISGIAVVTAPEKLLAPDDSKAENFAATGNSVTSNVVSNSHYDLVLVSTIDDPSSTGDNCFSGNTYTTSLPENLEQLVPCDKPASSDFEAQLATFGALVLGEKPPAVDYRTVTLPQRSDLPDMPRARTARPRSAMHEPSIKVAVARVKVPPAPTG